MEEELLLHPPIKHNLDYLAMTDRVPNNLSPELSAKPTKLSEVKGWLEDDDPFFATLEMLREEGRHQESVNPFLTLDADFYVYKMTTDNGGAPCVTDNLLSLAICKPILRRVAKTGSIILGFGSDRPGYDRRLIYIAVVTEKLLASDSVIDGKLGYYQNPVFQDRSDAIYRLESDGKSAALKTNAQHHSGGKHLKTDVGAHFENANVLLSTDFRYFGSKGTCAYTKFEHVKELVAKMGRGYRVNHSTKTYYQLVQLVEEEWRNPAKIQGLPTSPNKGQSCNTGKIVECPSC